MENFFDWKESAGSQLEKFYKTTLWQGEHVMVGLNCLDPKQTQKSHAHEGADKFYFVLEGSGHFTVGDVERDAASESLLSLPLACPMASPITDPNVCLYWSRSRRESNERDQNFRKRATVVSGHL